MTRHRRLLRLRTSMTVLILVFVGVGCADSSPRTAADSRSPIEPTPQVEATLRVAVGATISAAVQASDQLPATEKPAQPAVATMVTVRPTAMPAPRITARSTSAPTATPTIRVEAVNFNVYRIESGWTFIQGFVQNGGTSSAGGIQVVVSLIANGDTIVGSSQAHVKPDMLRPGDRSPWLAQVQGAPQFQRVRVRVEAYPLTDILRSTVTQDFRLEGVTVRPPGTSFSPPTIAGEVLNVGDKPATDVRVTAAIYAGDGALYQVASALVTPSEIAPGQSAPFEIRPVGRGLTEIPAYELFVDGHPRP